MNEWDQFLKNEDISRDIIGVKRVYIKMAGDVASGVMLSQIVYWFLLSKKGEKKTTVEFKGEDWIAKKLTDWDEECCLTPDQARRCLKVLEDKGLIVCSIKKFQGTPMTHVRLVKSAVLEAYKGGGTPSPLGENPKSEVVETPSPDGENPKSYIKEETTPETTTDIKTLTAGAVESTKVRDLEIVEGAFRYYCGKFDRDPKQYSLTPKRRDKAILRLQERAKHVGIDNARREFKTAIDNLAGSDYHRTSGYIDWIDQIFKSAEEFEKRVNWKPSQQRGNKSEQQNRLIDSNNAGLSGWLASSGAGGHEEASPTGELPSRSRPVLGSSS